MAWDIVPRVRAAHGFNREAARIARDERAELGNGVRELAPFGGRRERVRRDEKERRRLRSTAAL